MNARREVSVAVELREICNDHALHRPNLTQAVPSQQPNGGHRSATVLQNTGPVPLTKPLAPGSVPIAEIRREAEERRLITQTRRGAPVRSGAHYFQPGVKRTGDFCLHIAEPKEPKRGRQSDYQHSDDQNVGSSSRSGKTRFGRVRLPKIRLARASTSGHLTRRSSACPEAASLRVFTM